MSHDSVFGNFSAVAAAFGAHHEVRLKMYRPVTRAMCREAAVPETPPAPGYSLVDVAGGTGDVALEVAAGLGSDATVWCADIVPEMVTQAARESLRVLKPGGRVVYGVWGTRAVNPFHHVVQDVLDRHVARAAEDPDAPGAFRHATPGKLASILREAGATDVRETTFRFHIELPSFEHYFDMRTTTSDTLREKLRRMPDAVRAQFKNEVEQGASPYRTPDGIRFPAETLIVSGARMNGGPSAR